MDVAATGQAQNPTASSVASAKLTENFDAFLTLLTTQLKNQDPTEPMDSKEFVAQLTQFSGVEQAIRTNQSLEKLIDLQNTSQTTAALGYIGNQVEVTGDIASLDNGKAEYSYTLPETAAASKVVIQNESGQVVFSTAGETATGRHSFIWDGLDSSGTAAAPGIYRISVSAQNADGDPITGVKTTAFGTVTGIDTGAAGITLSLNGAAAPIASVLSVRTTTAGTP